MRTGPFSKTAMLFSLSWPTVVSKHIEGDGGADTEGHNLPSFCRPTYGTSGMSSLRARFPGTGRDSTLSPAGELDGEGRRRTGMHCGVMLTGYNQRDWERLLAEDYSR